MTTATHVPAADPGTSSARSVSAHREWTAPVVLAAVVGALLVASPLIGTSGGPYRGDIGRAFWAAAGVVSVAAVVLGRRSTVWATLLAALPFAIVPWSGVFMWAWLLALVAIAVLGALTRLRRAVVPFIAAAGVVAMYCASDVPALLPIGPVTSGTGSGFDAAVFGFYLGLMAAAVGVAAASGASWRARDRQARAQTQEQHALEVHTLAAERSRVARDLHDVVAHHVSLVVVRAESAPYQYPDLDDRAREVLTAVAADARQALGELRQVLTVLQRTGDARPGSPLAPQPGADDVARLVAEARDAGQDVTVSGQWGPVPSSVGYVLYRAAQEGLTNARRHAPARPAALRLRRTGERVGFRLSNTVGARDDARDVAGDAEPGRGLIGMRERVEALRGSVTTEVVEGDFVLDVSLPLTPPDAAGEPA